jgi:hypothetical protein
MKSFLFRICVTALFLMALAPCLGANRVVVVPLVKHTTATGNAIPADVVEGKTFATVEGRSTGIRPFSPVGTDYVSIYGSATGPIVGPGIDPPDPRFVQFEYNGVVQEGYGVQDRMTGLIWLQSPSPGEQRYGEAHDSCDSLLQIYQVGSGMYMSAGDWRLPTVREMESLFNYAQTTPNALVQPNLFTNVNDGLYWTSTVNRVPCGIPEGAWCNTVHVVDINHATVEKVRIHPDQALPELFFWCVRGPYSLEY